MLVLRRLWIAALPILLLLGCAEELTTMPVDKTLVQAVFDPSSSDVPTPTDLIKNPLTGLLAVPTAAGSSKAQAQWNAYLSSLDGYPTGAGAEVSFSGAIDKTSISAKTILVFSLAAGATAPVPVTGLTFTPTELKDKDGKVTRTKVAIKPAKGGWARTTQYIFFVLTGANGVKAATGAPIIRSALFDLATGLNPLCEWDAKKYWYTGDKVCKAEAEVPLTVCTQDSDCLDGFNYGKCDTKAGKCTTGTFNKVKGQQGCCIFNYSYMLESVVSKTIKADTQYAAFTEAELHAVIHKAVLDSATSFERMRQGYNALLEIAKAAKVDPSNVALLWNFTTWTMPELTYDPTSGIIPFPNALLMDQTTGKVKLPLTGNESAGEKALIEGLNTLDGFSTLGVPYVAVSGEVDPTTVAGGVSMIAMDLDAKIPVGNFTFTYDDKAKAIVATPTSPLKEGTTYGILMFSKMTDTSSVKSAGGLKAKNGDRFASSSFMGLIKISEPLIDTSKKSTISTVDDATANMLEPARLAHQELWKAMEALTFKRDDIVCAWTFKTQTMTDTLTKLRALPYTALAAVDTNLPKFTGTYDTTLTGYPTLADKSNIAGWVKQGVYDSINAIDEAGTGAFLTDMTKAKGAGVPFTLTIPKATTSNPMPTAGWPVVIFQHGLDNGRLDVTDIADTFAKDGYATIAVDVIYHGDRSWCTQDLHCDPAPCDTKTGKCTASGVFADIDKDGIPDASGARFLNVSNPFAIRDNFRQHVIDISSLTRAISLGAAAGIVDSATTPQPAGIVLDPTKVSYVGISLGSILGTLVMAVDPLPKYAVLSVPGSPVVDIILTSPAYKTIKDGVLKGFGITEGTLNYLQKIYLFKTILDPADPGNFAQYLSQLDLTKQLKDEFASAVAGKDVMVPLKKSIIQLAGDDQTIPVALGKNMASWATIDTTKTFYANQGHSFLLTPGTKEPNATKAAQKQAVTFIKDGKTICTPDVTKGDCI